MVVRTQTSSSFSLVQTWESRARSRAKGAGPAPLFGCVEEERDSCSGCLPFFRSGLISIGEVPFLARFRSPACLLVLTVPGGRGGRRSVRIRGLPER